jgi:hypothetical protein
MKKIIVVFLLVTGCVPAANGLRIDAACVDGKVSVQCECPAEQASATDSVFSVVGTLIDWIL